MHPRKPSRCCCRSYARTLNNIEKRGIADALTGPIARGDIDTVEAHCRKIEQFLPDLLPFYQVMGRYTLPLAHATVSAERRDALAAVLKRSWTARPMRLPVGPMVSNQAIWHAASEADPAAPGWLWSIIPRKRQRRSLSGRHQDGSGSAWPHHRRRPDSRPADVP